MITKKKQRNERANRKGGRKGERKGRRVGEISLIEEGINCCPDCFIV